MPFKHFPKSKLVIVDADGQERCRTEGIVSGDTILVSDPNAVIEPNDEIRRALPGNREEVFVARDPVFFDAMRGIPAHYQIKTSRKGTMEAGTGGHYNITVSGANSRVNLNSSDRSSNVVIGDVAIFSQLADAIRDGVADELQRQQLLDLVAKMNANVGKPSFIECYQHFIESAAAHMTVLAPFLPGLTKFLS